MQLEEYVVGYNYINFCRLITEKKSFFEGKYGINVSQCISGNIMPHIGHIAILNFAMIHRSDNVKFTTLYWFRGSLPHFEDFVKFMNIPPLVIQCRTHNPVDQQLIHINLRYCQ